MAYEDPLAARYERVNISLNAYEMEAIRRTCRAFKKKRADLLYRWVFEPESKIAQDSRAYFHSVVDSIEADDIRACAWFEDTEKYECVHRGFMFGKTILKAGKSEIEALKKRYRLTRLSDQEALQVVWERMSADPSFHTKNLDKNRTDLGQKWTQVLAAKSLSNGYQGGANRALGSPRTAREVTANFKSNGIALVTTDLAYRRPELRTGGWNDVERDDMVDRSTPAEIKRFPASRAERKIIYERKAHKAALDIRHAGNKQQAIRTFLKYLRRSI